MINGKGAFAIGGSDSGIVAIALIAIIVAIFFFCFLVMVV
jgi:hypothetical protein